MNIIQFAANYPLGFFSDTSILFAFVVGFPLSTISSRAVLFFKGYVWWLTIRNLIGLWTSSERMNNLFLYNLDLPIQVVIMLFVFGSLVNRPLVWQVSIAVMVLFCLFFLVDLFISNPNIADWHNHRMNRYAHVVANGLMIILVLFFFWQLTITPTVPNLLRYPFFWVACGLLIYSAGSIFLAPFYYYDNVWQGPFNLNVLQYIENGVVIICNLLFGIAMWQTRQTERISPTNW